METVLALAQKLGSTVFLISNLWGLTVQVHVFPELEALETPANSVSVSTGSAFSLKYFTNINLQSGEFSTYIKLLVFSTKKSFTNPKIPHWELQRVVCTSHHAFGGKLPTHQPSGQTSGGSIMLL